MQGRLKCLGMSILLGLMGFPMTQHLLGAGYDVYTTGHSNSKASVDRIDAFKAIGGKVELDIIDVVKDVDIIISILPADKEVREVFLNKEICQHYNQKNYGMNQDVGKFMALN